MKLIFQAMLIGFLPKGLGYAAAGEGPKKAPNSTPAVESSLDNLETEKVNVYALPSEGPLRGVKATFFTRKISLDDFWDVITDYNHYSEFMPLIKKSKIVKTSGLTLWVELGLKFGFTELDYQLKMDHKKEKNRAESSWNRTSGDLKAVKGSWLIEDQENLVKVTYVSYLDSGFLVPGWLESYLTENSVPDLFQAVLERAYQLANKGSTAVTSQREISKMNSGKETSEEPRKKETSQIDGFSRKI